MTTSEWAEGTTLRLMTRPHLQRRSHGVLIHLDRFEAWLGDELICVSRQPRLDGARVLLERDIDPPLKRGVYVPHRPLCRCKFCNSTQL